MIRSFKLRTTTIIDALLIFYIVCILILTYSSNYRISNITAVILMGLLAIYALRRKHFVVSGLPVFLFPFLGICFLSILWAVDRSMAFGKCVTLTELFILSILLYNYIIRENKLDFFLNAIIIACSIFSIYTISAYGLSGYIAGFLSGRRMGSVFQNTNGIGIANGPAFLISVWYLYYFRKKIYWIPAVLCGIVVIGTISRTALLATFGGLLITFLLKGNSLKKIKSFGIVAILLVGVYFLIQLPAFSGVYSRFDLLIDAYNGKASATGGTAIRFRMVEIGLEYFKHHPLTGVGIGCSAYITSQLGLFTYLHNNYVELLSSIGIIGFIAYYLLYIVPSLQFLERVKSQEPYAIIGLVLIAFRLLAQFGTVEYSVKATYLYFIIFFALCRKIKDNLTSDFQMSEGGHYSNE